MVKVEFFTRSVFLTPKEILPVSVWPFKSSTAFQLDCLLYTSFACGSYYEGTGNLQTHFIHVVRTNSTDWLNYINFRDYLNSTPSAAKEYEALKLSLARQPAAANAREKYLAGKHDFIVRTLKKARTAM